MNDARQYQLSGLAIWAVCLFIVVYYSIELTGSKLIYTLDDPYIHLSLAEMINIGRYGVNITEFSSPSSSILYPFFLAILLRLGLGTWGPLLLGAFASGLSVWILLGFFWKYAVDQDRLASRLLAYSAAPFLILAVNAIALPMTGMEHSLHVLATIGLVAGVARLAEEDRLSPWVPIAVVALPLIRFEGFALAAAGILVLIYCKKYLAAVGAVTLLGAALFIYVTQMNYYGLPAVPSSVLVKSPSSSLAADGSIFLFAISIAKNVSYAVQTRWGSLFFITICVLCLSINSENNIFRFSPSNIIPFLGIAGLTAHIMLGQYGWFHRYEVYAAALMLMCSIYVLSPMLKCMVTANPLRSMAVIGAVAMVGVPYLSAIAGTPSAAENIFQQQYQMHRFATEYFPYRVAVNDLGWVSFRNDEFVLDLWGLGSEKVRRLRNAGGFDANALSAIVSEAGITYAMIYDEWFEGIIPNEWCPTALLTTTKVTAASAHVAFYLIDRSKLGAMDVALSQFERSLPVGVSLARLACDG